LPAGFNAVFPKREFRSLEDQLVRPPRVGIETREAKMRYVKWFAVVVLVALGIAIFGPSLGWFSGAVDVVQEQTEPHEVQRRYEWFKDASAQLEKKRAEFLYTKPRSIL